LGEYFFDHSYGSGDDPTDYYCAGDGPVAGPHGVTKDRDQKQSVLVLCDTSFRNNGGRLHTVNPTCADASTLTGNKAPQTATRIDSVGPEAETLFHELFHTVLSNSHSKPSHGEIYSAANMLGKTVIPSTGSVMTTDAALVNPQTYTLTA
jgi:hypothetical protein